MHFLSALLWREIEFVCIKSVIPVAILFETFAFFEFQAKRASRWQQTNSVKEGQVTEDILESEVLAQSWITKAHVQSRMFQQGLDLGREKKHTVSVVIVERSHTGASACQEESTNVAIIRTSTAAIVECEIKPHTLSSHGADVTL